MIKIVLLLLLVPLALGSNAENKLSECAEDIAPLESLILQWPGLPAGGVKKHKISETVTLKFIVNRQGAAENIKVVDFTSRVYLRGAKRTIAKTRFQPPKEICIKSMKIQYQDEISLG